MRNSLEKNFESFASSTLLSYHCSSMLNILILLYNLHIHLLRFINIKAV